MSSRARSHDEIEALIAADVLGGLDQPDRRLLQQELADHEPGCADCRRLILEYSEVAGHLAIMPDPAPLTGGAEEELLRAARAQRIRPVAGRARRFVAVAAVAAVVALVSGTVGYVLAPGMPAQQRAALAFVSQPGVRVIGFKARGEQHLAVAFRPGRAEGWVIGNLQDPPDGKVYELWFQPVGAAGFRPAGTFAPRGGTVASPATLGGTFSALAVSVEPPGGSKQPTSAPIFVATASA